MESEQAAAHASVMDVLEGFSDLFGRHPFAPAQGTPAVGSAAAPAGAAAKAAPAEEQAPAEGSAPAADASAQGQEGQPEAAPQTLPQVLADVRGRVACGQALGSQPLLAMRLLLAGVQPLHVQRDVEQQLPASEAAAARAAAKDALSGSGASAPGKKLAMPCFPLVTPKLAALAGQLMQYRPTAAAGAAAEAAEGGKPPKPSAGWCGIVFVSQRMATWALHKLLRWAWVAAVGLQHLRLLAGRLRN